MPDSRESNSSEKIPKWALITVFLLSSILLASQDTFRLVLGHDSLNNKISHQEGQISALNDTVANLTKTQSYQSISIDELKNERTKLLFQVSELTSKLESEVEIRELLQEELDKKEDRIRELEDILSKLTDGSFGEFE